MNEIELLKKLTKELTEHTATTKQLNLALKLLIRIKRTYPYIFGECITKEEVDKLGAREKK